MTVTPAHHPTGEIAMNRSAHIRFPVGWRRSGYAGCNYYEELVRDDGRVLGFIMRFDEEEDDGILTYATAGHRRLGGFAGDEAARAAVERFIEAPNA